MDPNLIVTYGTAGYLAAKNEVHNCLTGLGDQKSEQELLVPGVLGVKTKLAARKVLEELKDLHVQDPQNMTVTNSWFPADFWCETNIDAIRNVVKEEIKDMMTASDRYDLQVINRKGSLSRDELVAELKPLLKGTMTEEFPNKLVRIEVFDKLTCVTLVLVRDVFVLRD